MNSKLRPLYTPFLYSIKLSEYRTEIKFDKDPLAVEQNKYLTKIVIISDIAIVAIKNVDYCYCYMLLITLANLKQSIY